MLKRLFFTLLLILLLGIGWGVYTHLIKPALTHETNGAMLHTSGNETASSVADKNPEEAESLNLALKTILLKQGEGGSEIWRLKAEWAKIQKEGGRIFVEQPRLVYSTGDEDSPLLVNSAKGEVDQQEQMLLFIKDVQVTQDNKRLTGSLLVYDGKAKTMSLPGGGTFLDTGVTGSARRLVWHINTKTIEAEGEVSVFFQTGKTTAP